MIIDCHTHLNNYTPDRPSTLQERYQQLKAEMKAHGVDYALVLTSFMVNEHRPSLDEVLETVGDDPEIGVIAGVSYRRYTAHDLAEIRL
ncbi:MAG TPA: amidohydrolase, partial [Thermoanaerobaculia bacterium]|nr:amidohydrolase [Thermoanaerobaculia bacterium]